MRFEVNKTNLVEALARCLPVADSKAIDRTLASVLLEARSSVSATTTDLYRAMTAEIQGPQANTGGAICLPAKDLHERIKLMPDGVIVVSTEGTKATISARGSKRRFTMAGLPREDFPSVPRVTGGEQFKTTTHNLAELISSVQHAVCLDSSRLNLNGILLEFDANGQRAVATDGHRLATVLHGAEPAGSRWLVPQIALADIRRLCTTGADEDITLTHDNGTMFAEFAGYTFSTKLINSNFVPWQSVVPTQSERVVRVPREALANGIRAVSVSSGPNGAVRLTFKKGALALQADVAQGEGFDEIEIDYEGREFTIAVSFRLLLDALNVLATDTVTVATGGEMDPLVIRIPGHDDAFLALVMPLRA